VRGIEDKIDTFVEENGEISEKEILNIIKESIDAVYSFWSKAKKLKHIPKDHDRLIIRKHEKDFKEIIKVSFRKLPLSNKQKKQLLEVFGWIFTKELFPNSCSGVVIAGFGESEIFPALISYEFEGIFENEVKFMESDKSEKISYDNQATITPFAQSEMVYSFMEGVDPDYQEKLQEGLVNIFDVYKNEICENIIPDKDKEGEVRKKLTSVNKKILSGLGEELAKYRNQVNVGPIMKAVAALPIEELALMAESLVNLTSFKRKVSMQRETVGGPIDVAVISKGDGFIWIKRKHYFEPDKNPHFFANYYNKCDNNFNGKKDDKRKDL
jgi:hypothetical protein